MILKQKKKSGNYNTIKKIKSKCKIACIINSSVYESD